MKSLLSILVVYFIGFSVSGRDLSYNETYSQDSVVCREGLDTIVSRWIFLYHSRHCNTNTGKTSFPSGLNTGKIVITTGLNNFDNKVEQTACPDTGLDRQGLLFSNQRILSDSINYNLENEMEDIENFIDNILIPQGQQSPFSDSLGTFAEQSSLRRIYQSCTGRGIDTVYSREVDLISNYYNLLQ